MVFLTANWFSQMKCLSPCRAWHVIRFRIWYLHNINNACRRYSQTTFPISNSCLGHHHVRSSVTLPNNITPAMHTNQQFHLFQHPPPLGGSGTLAQLLPTIVHRNEAKVMPSVDQRARQWFGRSRTECSMQPVNSNAMWYLKWYIAASSK